MDSISGINGAPVHLTTDGATSFSLSTKTKIMLIAIPIIVGLATCGFGVLAAQATMTAIYWGIIGFSSSALVEGIGFSIGSLLSRNTQTLTPENTVYGNVSKVPASIQDKQDLNSTSNTVDIQVQVRQLIAEKQANMNLEKVKAPTISDWYIGMHDQAYRNDNELDPILEGMVLRTLDIMPYHRLKELVENVPIDRSQANGLSYLYSLIANLKQLSLNKNSNELSELIDLAQQRLKNYIQNLLNDFDKLHELHSLLPTRY